MNNATLNEVLVYEAGYEDGRIDANVWYGLSPLPKDGEKVLAISAKDGLVLAKYFHDGGHWCDHQMFTEYKDITHWKKAPELPEKEGA